PRAELRKHHSNLTHHPPTPPARAATPCARVTILAPSITAASARGARECKSRRGKLRHPHDDPNEPVAGNHSGSGHPHLYNPNQPRVPAGQPDGGQCTG